MNGREIKFRVWYGKHGQGMVAISSISFDSEIEPLNGLIRKPVVIGKYQSEGKEWGCSISDQEPMQYTGLKDKNGREIYEGDIVLIRNWRNEYTCSNCGHNQISSMTAKIIWQNESITGPHKNRYNPVARFALQYKTGEIYELNSDNIEVIGNIYENPELGDCDNAN